MPRHTFSFPKEVRDIVREYVDSRVFSIDAERFNQEPKYVSALLSKLEGVVYEGNSGFIKFEVTDIDDRGPNSAESIYGADFAITAEISDGIKRIRKAIFCQAKLGAIEEMDTTALDFLKDQIEKMKRHTRSPKVLEIDEYRGVRFPSIISGNQVLEDSINTSTSLSNYIVRRVLTTLDGDTRKSFVDAVQHSSLPKLNVLAVTNLITQESLNEE